MVLAQNGLKDLPRLIGHVQPDNATIAYMKSGRATLQFQFQKRAFGWSDPRTFASPSIEGTKSRSEFSPLPETVFLADSRCPDSSLITDSRSKRRRLDSPRQFDMGQVVRRGRSLARQLRSDEGLAHLPSFIQSTDKVSCGQSVTLVEYRSLHSLLGRPSQLRLTQIATCLNDLLPCQPRIFHGSKVGFDDTAELLFARHLELHDKVEAPEERVVQQIRMIGRRGNEAIGRVRLLHELQSRIEHPAHLPDIVGRTTMTTNGIKFVEEIDTAALRCFVEHQPQFRGRLPHETRDQRLKPDHFCILFDNHQERQLQRSGQRFRCHRLADPGGPRNKTRRLGVRPCSRSQSLRTCSRMSSLI